MIIASDGLFDNLFDEEIAEIVNALVRVRKAVDMAVLSGFSAVTRLAAAPGSLKAQVGIKCLAHGPHGLEGAASTFLLGRAAGQDG
jgi:hypothetical protein